MALTRFHPGFSKHLPADIAPIQTDIFQDSIDSGTVPHRWKEANVCAVFKKGKKSDPANYRPISLTCVASKILEHIVHSFIMKHLNDHNILTDCQHGFRAKRSTELLSPYTTGQRLFRAHLSTRSFWTLPKLSIRSLIGVS